MRMLVILGIALGWAWAPAAAAAAGPELHVTVPHAGLDAAEHGAYVERISGAIREALREADVDARHVDVVVSRLAVRITRDRVDICAEINVVVSTAVQIRAFASGTATFSIPRRQYTAARAPALRRQTVNDALDAVQRRLRVISRPVA